MLKRWAAGFLYLVTALFTGYWGLRFTFAPAGVWWLLTMLGAPILMLVGGVLTLFPRVKKVWLVALAGTILFVIWVAFIREFLWVYWVFAVAVVLVTWGILALASALKREWLAGFVASVILAASWAPVSVEVWVEYFSPKNPGTDQMGLILLVLVPWVLIVASLIAGVALSKSPQTATGSRGLGAS